MLTAHYVGPAKPGVLAYLGWWLIRLGQKAPYSACTHTEAIHEVHSDGSVTMASSSLMDKGVRRKTCKLNPAHWVIVDVPGWDVRDSVRYFEDAIARGIKYDKRGALATMLPGKESASKVFCTESVLKPFHKAAHYFAPAQGLAICLSQGIDATEAFFGGKLNG